MPAFVSIRKGEFLVYMSKTHVISRRSSKRFRSVYKCLLMGKRTWVVATGPTTKNKSRSFCKGSSRYKLGQHAIYGIWFFHNIFNAVKFIGDVYFHMVF